MSRSSFAETIQIGRAFAAMAVALQHTVKDADRYYPRYVGSEPGFASNPHSWVENLGAGVDVFFVISGVVMVLSTQHRTPSAGEFLYRRLVRIYPLYWILTIAYIALLLVLPNLFQTHYVELKHAVCSLALVPCLGPGGEAIPYIYAGWTLTYELVFYGLFALSLFVSGRSRQLMVCATLVVLWHLWQYTPWVAIPAVEHSSGNIILEFLFGLAIGYAWTQRRFASTWALPLIVVGLVLLAFGQTEFLRNLPRVLHWGVPAALIVAGLLCWQERCTQPSPAWFRLLVYIGTISYSLYLFHFFSLRLFYVGFGKTGLLGQIPPAVTVLIGFVFTLAASAVVYHVCERPLHNASRTLHKRFRLQHVASSS